MRAMTTRTAICIRATSPIDTGLLLLNHYAMKTASIMAAVGIVGCLQVPAVALEKPEVVVVFADSIALSPGLWQQNWTITLAEMRPDLEIVNRGWPGETSFGASEYKTIKRMARRVRDRSTESLVLTPTPTCPEGWGAFGANSYLYTREMTERLFGERRLNVYDVRGRVEFDWRPVVPDCVHPNAEGADRIAEVVSEAIP